ncbi:hypothetical protein [uncultured Dokdonia sp.]|uniref:hypothetical protein n=1 Tax=uncultured Dokdonia sp. TaxID=575653 RepID=UPI0026116854|nr:hypothetical protein [uncultured Dokdonia sp.]
MSKNAISILLAIVLTVVGYILYRYFFIFSLHQLDELKSPISMHRLSGLFRTRILFSLVIGSIPLLYLAVNKFAKLKSLPQKLAVVGMIMSLGVLFWQLRIVYLSKVVSRLLGTKPTGVLDVSISFQVLQLEVFLLIGFIWGALISVLIFRSKNK